ncbi:MAG: hypothetical protein E4H10_14000, partial [Bacteroidia bacterium]
MSTRKKHRTIIEYLRYLKGELSNEERHALERDLEVDPFEKEAMEGFEMITPGELEEDILSLHSSLRKRQQRKIRMALYGIAATVASILVVGTIFINIYDFNPEADRETVQAEESLLMEKSPEPSEPAAAEAKDLDEEIAEMQELSGKRDAIGPGAAKKIDAQADKEEVLVPDQDLVVVAAEAADEEVAGVAARQMAREEVPELEGEAAPEISEKAAPMPEADAVMAVEAAPAGRQKRAMSNARTVPSNVGQVSGVVVSAEDNDPLPGASVMVKGTDSGYVADMQGRFSV